jgi:hypothetical protein
MRYLFVLIPAILFATTSCSSNKKTAEAKEPKTDTVVVIMEKPEQSSDSLLISFEKTPCFGRCPVYKIKVYESGFATYEGLNFAERMGLYAYRFSDQKIEEILQSARNVNYTGLDPEYDDPRITDLPSTISKIKLEGKYHRVVARVNIPQEVKNFHSNLDVALTENDWKPYSLR